MSTRTKQEDKTYALSQLRRILNKGDRIITTLKHVNRMGTFRVLGVYVIKKNRLLWLSRFIAMAEIGTWNDKHEGIASTSCGSDSGHNLVCDMSLALHGMKTHKCRCEENGKKYDPGQRCWHKAGYTLNHEWI